MLIYLKEVSDKDIANICACYTKSGKQKCSSYCPFWDLYTGKRRTKEYRSSRPLTELNIPVDMLSEETVTNSFHGRGYRKKDGKWYDREFEEI